MKRWAVTIALAGAVFVSSAAAQTPTAPTATEDEAFHWAYVNAVEHDSPWRVCRTFIDAGNNRTCRVTRQLPFAARGDFLGLWELRMFDGEASYSAVAVAGPNGVALANLVYRADDPNDPGCPSITRAMGLDRAWVEDGHLVLVSVGETQAYVDPVPHNPDDYGMRTKLIRGVFVLSWVDTGLQTKDYTPWGGPTYGHKMGGPPGSVLSWDSIPWQQRSRPKVVDGKLLISS